MEELHGSLSALLGEPPVVVVPPARFWTEDQVVDFRGRKYRIVSRLGSGGVGTTFKVVELDGATGGDLGAYVAKVVWDEATGERVLPAYDLARSPLAGSAGLSTIFETAAEWRDNGFVALMQWVEGEPLSELAGVLPILAEDLQEEAGEVLALRWLRAVCDALDVLYRNGLVHGDVSPRNYRSLYQHRSLLAANRTGQSPPLDRGLARHGQDHLPAEPVRSDDGRRYSADRLFLSSGH